MFPIDTLFDENLDAILDSTIESLKRYTFLFLWKTSWSFTFETIRSPISYCHVTWNELYIFGLGSKRNVCV